VGIEDEHLGRADNESPARAALEIEFRCAERQTIATFRESFLRWMNDRTGPLSRALGAPDRLSLDEVPPGEGPHGTQTLRLRVSWPAARSVPQPVLLRASTSPGAGNIDAVPIPASLVPVDHYVFFPDPPHATAPLFRELSVPLRPDALQPTGGTGRLRLERSTGASLLRRSSGFLAAVQALARRTAGGLTLSRLTLRLPGSPAPRAGRLAALGAGAMAVGFLAGTVYLTTTGRKAPMAPAAQAALVAPQAAAPALPVAAPGVVPNPLLLPARQPDATPPAPPVEAPERSADANHLERGLRPERVAASAADAGIPDTEVTPAPRPPAAVRTPVAVRRAGPVVVSAHADASASAVRVGGRPMLGTLLVKSDPQGAEVSINGVVLGRTPLLIRGVGAGSRVVRLALPGYARWSWAVAVPGDKQTPVNVKLQPESRGSANPND
jgi:PEGA domain-containing protein